MKYYSYIAYIQTLYIDESLVSASSEPRWLKLKDIKQLKYPIIFSHPEAIDGKL